MSDNLSAPNFGTGPYAAERDPAVGMAWITKDGVRTGKSYVEMKTAARVARQLNEEEFNAEAAQAVVEAESDAPEFLDDPELESETYLDGPPVKGEAIPKTVPKPKAAPAPKAPVTEAEGAAVLLYQTRDEWLNAFISAARPVFKAAGLELPEKVRASIGWMFRSSNKKTLGQCWHEASSADGTREIWINPTLGNLDSSRIADVLTHELAHTLFGPEEKHGKKFKAVVHKLGLEGKATATIAGEGWREWADPILATLGPIPHAALDPSLSGVAKKKTYLLKATCKACEFTFRATAKHLNGKALRCPDFECSGEVEVEGAEDLGEGDGE